MLTVYAVVNAAGSLSWAAYIGVGVDFEEALVGLADVVRHVQLQHWSVRVREAMVPFGRDGLLQRCGCRKNCTVISKRLNLILFELENAQSNNLHRPRRRSLLIRPSLEQGF